ncbi:putative Peptidoglycan domain protein [compost metagenome]
MHPLTASRFLQRALNWFNRGGLDYQDLTVDGHIGPATLSALDGFLRVRKTQGELVLLRALNALQGARYGELVENRAKDEEFIFGWFLNRVVI